MTEYYARKHFSKYDSAKFLFRGHHLETVRHSGEEGKIVLRGGDRRIIQPDPIMSSAC